jgi:hypothetical protein
MKDEMKEERPPRTPMRNGKIKRNIPRTPTTPITIGKNTYGSVDTPQGRRSARVAAKSAQKRL